MFWSNNVPVRLGSIIVTNTFNDLIRFSENSLAINTVTTYKMTNL